MQFAAINVLLPVAGCGLGLLALFFGLRAGKRQRLVDGLPTSKTTGIFIGLTEIKGTAECAQPLTSFLAERACVQYEFTVEEHWSRTVTETYTDSEGKTKTRTRHESGWTTVASGGESIPFYLKDDHGVVQVVPDGAKIENAPLFDETCGRGDALYYGKGPEGSVSNSDHRRRFVEKGIPLHTALYVMGQARERKDVVAPEIAQDKDAPMFLISVASEEAISKGLGGKYWFLIILGLVLCVGGLVGANLATGRPPEAGWPIYLLGGLAYFFLWGLGWLWTVYNSLVELRQRVRQGWAQVDVQLKRRHDLIPNLVNVVKGLRDHEQTLQTELAVLRAESLATPPGQPGPEYHAVAPVMVAVRERYPEISAQPAFLNLQKSLADTEQRIALARGYFNEIATHYNTRLEIVPDRLVAQLARLQPQTLMLANDFERAAVEVHFSS